MSDTVPAPTETSEPTPAVPAPVPVATSDTFGHFLAAVRLGAASIYHQVLAIESDVAAWTSSPAVAPLVQDAVTLVTGLLTSHGIPIGAIEIAGKAILAAMAQTAANDVTVKSGGSAS